MLSGVHLTRAAHSDLQLLREVVNLCSLDNVTHAAALIVRQYPDRAIAEKFVADLKGRYLGEDAYRNLSELVSALLE